MQLHCLGTVGFHPNHSRHTSCYFLPESGIVLDAGTGMFRLAPLIQTDSLDILLSHAHLDHTCGLTFLLDVLFERPVGQLRIWGEAAKLDAIRTHLFSELIFPVDLNAQWNAIDDLEEFAVGEVSVSWRRQDHPGGSVGYRLVWNSGERLVYATDTTGDTSAEAIEWYRGADLLMHECYFQDAAEEFALKTGHSWTSRVAEIAAACQPKQLLLTHLNPLDRDGSTQPHCGGVEVEKIRGKVDAEVMVAADGLVVGF